MSRTRRGRPAAPAAPEPTPVVTLTARPSRWRRLVGSPLAWAALCLAMAVPWAMAGQSMELFPYLLMLVGGWLCGFSFVNATLRMTPVRRGTIAHVIGAIVSAALVVVAVDYGSSLLATAPEWVRTSFVIVPFALIPAACWIWLGLIARFVAAVGSSKAKTPATTPEWVRAARGHGSEVRFSAVPITMRAVTTATVVIVVVIGCLAGWALVATGDLVYALGPRLTMIVIGLVFAMPAYFAVLAVVRRRTVAACIGFGNDRLWLGTGSSTTTVAFRDLEQLVWRRSSDAARVEVRGGGVDVSLVIGIAKPAPGDTAELPALPRRVLGRLQDEGFALERSRRGEVMTFRRSQPVE